MVIDFVIDVVLLVVRVLIKLLFLLVLLGKDDFLVEMLVVLLKFGWYVYCFGKDSVVVINW